MAVKLTKMSNHVLPETSPPGNMYFSGGLLKVYLMLYFLHLFQFVRFLFAFVNLLLESEMRAVGGLEQGKSI